MVIFLIKNKKNNCLLLFLNLFSKLKYFYYNWYILDFELDDFK